VIGSLRAFAHLGGFPVEETLAAFGPAFLAFGGVAAKLRARCLRCARQESNPEPSD
jgi:hypothetical protein